MITGRGSFSFFARRSPLNILIGWSSLHPSSSRSSLRLRLRFCCRRRFLRVLRHCSGFELRYARLLALLKLSYHVLAAC
jgi:hypothetical protein